MRFRNGARLTLGFVCSVIAAVCCMPALSLHPTLAAWALATPAQAQEKPDKQQPDEPAAKNVTVTGTIVKNGSDFMLREASGMIYRLDSPEKVEPFVGKSVKVTGTLEANNNTLYVEAIEEANV
jgi:hypothetical protein